MSDWFARQFLIHVGSLFISSKFVWNICLALLHQVFQLFYVFVGVKLNSSTHLLRCFFLWFDIFYWLQAFRTEMFFYCCVNLSVLNQITIIIVCRRADRVPQYLLININSKQIQYHCILLKMLLFLLFQTLWLQNFYILKFRTSLFHFLI